MKKNHPTSIKEYQIVKRGFSKQDTFGCFENNHFPFPAEDIYFGDSPEGALQSYFDYRKNKLQQREDFFFKLIHDVDGSAWLFSVIEKSTEHFSKNSLGYHYRDYQILVIDRQAHWPG